MSAAHTPGPWSFSKYTGYGDSRFYIAQAKGAPYTPNYSDVGVLIAETVGSERSAIQEANAHLMAASPEILQALNNLLNAYPVPSSICKERPAYDAAQTAIAKAEGRAV